MTEIKIRFDLTFGSRFVRAVSVAAIMLGAVPELESESVTLSTYYPAPSGVYTQMITTGNTYLARDSGSVGIRTATPGSTLDVNGTANVTGTATVAKYLGTGNNTVNTVDPKAADIVIGSDSGVRHDSSIMMWSNASASRIFQQSDVFYLSVWNQPGTTANVALAAGVGGNSYIQGNLQVGSNAAASRKLSVTGDMGATGTIGAAQVCGAVQYYTYASSFGGTTALCPGQYVTNVEGVYVHRYNMPPSDSANGSYICCPCPSGGCNL